MRSTNVTPRPAHAIHDRLRPIMACLLQLEERMEQRDVPRDGQLFALVQHAHDAARKLFLETHNVACKDVGRRRGHSQNSPGLLVSADAN